MTRRLTLEQALRLARVAVGGAVQVRDLGLLDAALHRPHATMFGQDLYPDLCDKAAALLHALVRNHPLVDGNKRLGWLSAYVFCAKNGLRLDPSDDDAYDLVLEIAAGRLDEVADIAAVLRSFVPARP